MPHSKERIWLSPPDMGSEERRLLLEAFDSNWVAPLGPQVDAFEKEFAELHGARHAIALSSGTASLHLALIAAGVGPGDRVACPTLTFTATANAIVYCGAEPVFIDSEPRSWNLCPNLLAEELGRSQRVGKPIAAVVAVDLFGQPAEYDRIRVCTSRYTTPLILDSAESLGASYRGAPSGTQGDIGCFSFNGNKIITTSGGGMVVTDRDDWATRIRHLASQAKDPAPHYEHSEIGYNYRLSNLLAAVGRGQLASLPQKVARRRQIFERYQEALADTGVFSFAEEAPGTVSTRWLTCATVDSDKETGVAQAILAALQSENIEARPVWKPMHVQPVHRGRACVGGEVAANIFRNGLCLPSGSSMTDLQQDRVIRTIQRALKSKALAA